jgi:hypothetical protein
VKEGLNFFLSFNVNHERKTALIFTGFLLNLYPESKIIGFSSKEVAGRKGKTEWEKNTQKIIMGCDLLIVLIGDSMLAASGVQKEVMMAIEYDIPLFGVYMNKTTILSVLPPSLSRGLVVPFTEKEISKMVEANIKKMSVTSCKTNGESQVGS